MDNVNTLNNLQSLKDITGIVQIPDNSLWYLLAIIFCIILIVLSVSYYFYTKHNKKHLPRKNALKVLKNLDFDNSKSVAYLFTKYNIAIRNNENTQRIQEIIIKLQEYKYKKSVEKLPTDLIIKIKEIIDV